MLQNKFCSLYTSIHGYICYIVWSFSNENMKNVYRNSRGNDLRYPKKKYFQRKMF
jgi:hypothetical protein